MLRLKKLLPPLRWKRLVSLCYVLGLAVIGLAAAFSLGDAALYAGSGIILVSSLTSLVFWRCPTCGRLLPHPMAGMEHCPFCASFLKDSPL